MVYQVVSRSLKLEADKGSRAMKFLVKDMSCQHCVRRISDALGRLDGAKVVTIDLEHKLVEVSGHASADAVIDVIKNAGYTAETK